MNAAVSAREGTGDVVLTVCKDEADVIEAFVRFHLDMGFDAIYVVDNGSTDGTREILRALADEGLPLRLRYDDRLGFEALLDEFYHWAGEQARPRWLFFLDADEFVYFPAGKQSYLDAIPDSVHRLRLLQRQIYPLGRQARAPRHRWPFLLSTTAGTTFDEEPAKVVTRYSPHAHVYWGKHHISLPGGTERTATDVIIRHYKYRTETQAAAKEAKRVTSHANVSGADLPRLSAFGVTAQRAWIEQSKRNQAARSWRSAFSPDRPLVTDRVIERWAMPRPDGPPRAEPACGLCTAPLAAGQTRCARCASTGRDRLLWAEISRRLAGWPAGEPMAVTTLGVSPALAAALRASPGVELSEFDRSAALDLLHKRRPFPSAEAGGTPQALFIGQDPELLAATGAAGLRRIRRAMHQHSCLLTATGARHAGATLASLVGSVTAPTAIMKLVEFDAHYFGAEVLAPQKIPQDLTLLLITPYRLGPDPDPEAATH